MDDLATVQTAHSILHPSDDTDASHRAFAHALRIALANRTDLTLLHVDTAPLVASSWWHPPAVRSTLRAWGILEATAPPEALYEQHGLVVRKTTIAARRTLDGINSVLAHLSTDLVVLSTQGRAGVHRWVKPSVAEQIARASHAATLFVPEGARSFVRLSDGDISLRRILIPIDHSPHAQRAVNIAIRLVESLSIIPTQVTLLHVGNTFPSVDLTAPKGWSWHAMSAQGDVVEAIIRTAGEDNADLIVMATQGHDGFLDALRGSTTDRVVRRAPCPVLAVPQDDTNLDC
ncbi:MAG: universal stress protein [Gammaproteobacteria bacterium]|nr:universal stress protein [Gammaproteobacteria bacterium]